MKLPDGSERAIEDLDVRLTEFTVGDDGRAAMPGELPPSSAYTWAAEFSVDEAVEAGATEVEFSKPVVTYIENFLEFDVGTPVPVGSFDRERGVWVGAPDGTRDRDPLGVRWPGGRRHRRRRGRRLGARHR